MLLDNFARPVRAQFDFALEPGIGTLDRVFDIAELCGFTVDQYQVGRFNNRAECSISMAGKECGLPWLADCVASALDDCRPRRS
jgi:hypothetical protein